MAIKEHVTLSSYNSRSEGDNIAVDQENTRSIPCSYYHESQSGSNFHENPSAKKRFLQSSYFGIFCSFLAGVFFTLAVVVIQKTSHSDPIQQSSLTALWFIVGTVPILVCTGRNVFGPSEQKLYCILRAALGAGGLHLGYVSGRLLPLPDLAVIFSTMPGMSSLAARLLLKEKCGLPQMLSLVLTAVGVLLVGRFPDLLARQSEERFTNDYITGFVCAIGSVLCTALANTLIRAMKDVHHFAVQLFHVGLVGLLTGGCVLAALKTDLPRCGWDDRLLILSGGLAYFAANCFLTLSMQSEAVAIATSIGTSTEVVAALLCNLVFFQRFPEAYDWSGAGVVLISAGIVGWIKWRRQRIEQAKAA